ncbi:MAG TPA: uroporphyrinogen-III synthase [Blastocatellia bacterium]|nr:uroporphyrinogen-III synthase [Blastocatellia bacterium]
MSTMLKGIRVGLLEARRANELAELIRRQGGEPLCAPAVRESEVDCSDQVKDFVERIARDSFDIVIFLTGVGATALFREAESLGLQSDLFRGLEAVTTVCRGPKPVAALKRSGVHIDIAAPEPNTTTELLAAMAHLTLEGKNVALQHYGERNVALVDALKARGARLFEMFLYEWAMPEDVEPLRQMVSQIIGGEVDVIAFTSQIQIRHLFKVAEESGCADALAQALNRNITVASIGPTCTGVLQSFGIVPEVIPDHPKMGHLVMALAAYIQGNQHQARPQT